MPNKDKGIYNEYLRMYMAERYKRRKLEATEFLGGVCKSCGSGENLQFDHKDRTTKFKSISRMWSYSEKKFWEEINKCQLLCEDCHYMKTCDDLGWELRPKHLRRNWNKKISGS